ncbi:MAG: hypothetical protein B7Y43_06330 [Sphingomonas sp. 28-62-20]|uniref:type II toxin-antitoxin system VapC family toxin n=1 Tax=Sphingomonas sp. 28-62-20 TaxID=1970433 RepID=UPI000BD4CDC0|nr:MAG: hypothetical protein B7Y43_06330 [Sphingomonas sp. 28-62-20]
MMVDTNIIVDLREEDGEWFEWSVGTLARLVSDGLTTSAIVLGELVARGTGEAEIMTQLAVFEIEPQALTVEAGLRAGLAQAVYRRAGGTREKLLADFLIGAHAVTERQPLITRDPRRYRQYFPELTLITPETDHG